MIINAFDPKFMKTYYPGFWVKIIADEKSRAEGVVNGAKSRATRESVQGQTVNTINAFPKTSAKRKK